MRRKRLRSVLGFGGETVGGRADAGLQRRLDDRPIAGAAAKIAGELIADRRRGSPARALIEREQAHHDAGRAEAALRAVQVDHRLLDGMKDPPVGEILDRQHFGAVDLAEQQHAGVDRLMGDRAVAVARQHDRAGAAIALAAAFLRARRAAPPRAASPAASRAAQIRPERHQRSGSGSAVAGAALVPIPSSPSPKTLPFPRR